MAVKEYDGTLAVAALVLAAVLQVLQINFIADGLAMASGQGWFLSTLFAIVISTGLLFSTFVTRRLWSKEMPYVYSVIFGAIALLVTGGMSAWFLTMAAEPLTIKWWFALFLGLASPAQTILLGNMTNEMLDL